MTGTAGMALNSVRVIEEEEMALFAESKENLSIAHSSSAALTELSGFPGEDGVPGCSVHHVSSLPAIASHSLPALSVQKVC